MKQVRTGSFAGKEFKFIAFDEESISLVPGFSGTCKDVSLTNHAYATHWTFEDEKEVRERHWHFSPGDVVLDVGPAFGSYTLTAAIQGASVIAFEPSLFSISILTENIKQNPDLIK